MVQSAILPELFQAIQQPTPVTHVLLAAAGTALEHVSWTGNGTELNSSVLVGDRIYSVTYSTLLQHI